MRKKIWAALALAVISMGPAACSQGEEETSTGEPDAPAGISVSDGRMMLPPVSGNPAAAYFNITNDGEEMQMIVSAHVQGAGMAVMHETDSWNLQPDMQEVIQQPVPAGETVSFEPGGLHLMVYDLADTLVEGGQTEVTLTFVRGDKVSFPVEIRAAGDDR